MADTLADGNETFIGGQDASKDPHMVPPDAFYSGINLNIDRGILSPRWGYSELDLLFNTPGGVPVSPVENRSFEIIFRSGRFQALIPYNIGSEYYLIVVIAGVIYAINQDTNQVIQIPIRDGTYIDENTPRLAWSPAGRYLVIWDYPAYPVIIEGLAATRADPLALQIPISVLGTYNQNRLFIANAGNEYTAGDPTGSPISPQAPITFEEVLVSSSPYADQIFSLPTSYNNLRITAMTFLQNVDTSTGIGPLIISTANEIYAAAAQLPRADWEANQFSSMIVNNTGIAGVRAYTNVGSDLFFLTTDGEIKPLSMSRDEQAKWSKSPLSMEVKNWLIYNDPVFPTYGAMGYFQNKIFATATPFRVKSLDSKGGLITDVANAGFVVLELNSLGTVRTQSPPAWTGIWTGINPMDITVNNGRCFVVSKDDSFINKIFEITPDKTYDVVNQKVRYVTSRVYSREYNFQTPYNNKEISTLSLGLQAVQGDFKVDVAYRPNQAYEFVPWRSFTHVAPWRACRMPTGCEFNGFEPHQFREVVIGSPEGADACNPVTRDNYSIFKEAQLKLTITGKYWEIKNWVIRAVPKTENILETVCEEEPPVTVCRSCNDDFKVEDITLCQTEHET